MGKCARDGADDAPITSRRAPCERLVAGREHDKRLLVEGAAFGGEGETLGVAHHECGVELAFERRDVRAHRGLGNMQ